MSLLDLLIVVVVGASTAAGFVAGFARVGIGFLATIFGLLFGFWFYGYPASIFYKFIHSSTLANLLGFFLVFWAILLAGALVARLIAKFFKWTGLSWLDRLLGGAFGLVRGALIAVVLVTVLMAFTPRKPVPNWMVDSKLLPYAVDASNMLAAMAPSSIKNAFRDSLNEIRTSWDEQLKRAKEKLQMRERENEKKAEPKPSAKGSSGKSPPSKKKKEDANAGRSFDF